MDTTKHQPARPLTATQLAVREMYPHGRYVPLSVRESRPNPQTLTRFDADGARDPWANDPDRTTRHNREATS